MVVIGSSQSFGLKSSSMTVRDERRRARRYALNWAARVRISYGGSLSTRHLLRKDSSTGPDSAHHLQDSIFAVARQLQKSLATRSISQTIKGSDNNAGECVIELAGRLKNLSSRGAYVYLEAPIPIGARLEISINLPLGREIWMNYAAVVVRMNNTSGMPGVALKFDTSRPSFSTGPVW